MGSDDLNRESDARRRAEPRDADERFDPHGVGNATIWEHAKSEEAQHGPGRSEAAPLTTPEPLWTGSFGAEARLWNGRRGRTLVTGDGTDWQFPDELKRKLKT